MKRMNSYSVYQHRRIINMKYIYYLLVCIVLSVFASCSEDIFIDNDSLIDDEKIAIESITAEINNVNTSFTRSDKESDKDSIVYIINDPTTYNPAYRKGTWKLFFEMETVDANSEYTKILTTNEDNYYIKYGNIWAKQEAQETLYFYSYMRGINARFLLSLNNRFSTDVIDQPIEQDQSTEDKLLEQDALFSMYSRFNPGKNLSVILGHLHAMLDFCFDTEPEDDVTITVEVNNKTYLPYVYSSHITSDSRSHYLLILPYNLSVNPVIKVKYTDSEYYTEVPIFVEPEPDKEPERVALGRNNRYLFTVHGKELRIASITIAEWKAGETFVGEYISPVAYPVFRGEPNTSYTLTYSNELSQTVTMNLRGERLAKPVGSKIVKVQKKDETAIEVNEPLSNFGQLIDLEQIIRKYKDANP